MERVAQRQGGGTAQPGESVEAIAGWVIGVGRMGQSTAACTRSAAHAVGGACDVTRPWRAGNAQYGAPTTGR